MDFAPPIYALVGGIYLQNLALLILQDKGNKQVVTGCLNGQLLAIFCVFFALGDLLVVRLVDFLDWGLNRTDLESAAAHVLDNWHFTEQTHEHNRAHIGTDSIEFLVSAGQVGLAGGLWPAAPASRFCSLQ